MKNIFIALSIVLFLNACKQQKSKEKVIIFHAGSLSYPLKAAINAFNIEYPNFEMVTESAGSLASARKITDLNRSADILALADYQIIDQMIIPEYSNFNVHFATNSIGLAYSTQSRFANEINKENWLEILKRPEVKIGASDPHADPCGYRTQLILQLGEILWGETDLVNQLLTHTKLHQRPKETDLIALLETHTIDYLFIYESVAKQHGLNFQALPDSINLSRPELNHWYKQANFTLRGTDPGTTVDLAGEAITYGITVLDKAPNKINAFIFLNWLLHPDKGMKAVHATQLKPLNPPNVHFVGDYPKELSVN